MKQFTNGHLLCARKENDIFLEHTFIHIWRLELGLTGLAVSKIAIANFISRKAPSQVNLTDNEADSS